MYEFPEALGPFDTSFLFKESPDPRSKPLGFNWAGFRPGSIKNIPIIKKDTNYENVFINSGHFRYGLTMAPKSAEIINSLLVKSEL